jgi:hypothetical protein
MAETNKRHSCGTFRKCEFADGVEKWIIVAHHTHAEGDTIWIKRQDETWAQVVLGSVLTVSIGDTLIDHCFAIAPPAPGSRPPRLVAAEPSVVADRQMMDNISSTIQ